MESWRGWRQIACWGNTFSCLVVNICISLETPKTEALACKPPPVELRSFPAGSGLGWLGSAFGGDLP